MMGSRQEAQGALFYAFSTQAHISPDHMLGSVDQCVDQADIRQHLAPFYSATGRPFVDPELMTRMLRLGYIMGTRSERRHCKEVRLNLADTDAVSHWIPPQFTTRRDAQSMDPDKWRSQDLPVVLIWGELDTVAPLAQGEEFAELTRNATLKVRENMGYIPHLEAPSAFAETPVDARDDIARAKEKDRPTR